MKLNIPNVSVIVPIYNSEDYLTECLDSILNQTLKSIEIICVNDGSLDDSGKILKDYQEKDPRIVIINKKNGGLSSARNSGIVVATGEYIGFIDSDDWIDEFYFEKLYQAAKSNNADISMGNFKWFSQKSKLLEQVSWVSKIMKSIKSEIVTEVLDRKKIIVTSTVCNKLFSRDFINTNNFLFYEGLFWEDNPFTITTTIKANKICIIRDVFYHCRKHENSITGTAAFDRKPFDIFEIMKNLKTFFDSEDIDTKAGYQHYYDELIYFNYYSHLFDRVQSKYRKEFYLRIKDEFNNLNRDSIEHLSNNFVAFRLIHNNTYTFFMLIYYLKKIVYNSYFSISKITLSLKLK